MNAMNKDITLLKIHVMRKKKPVIEKKPVIPFTWENI